MASEAEYWTRRKIELLSQLENDEAKLNAKLAKIYQAEEKRLSQEIAEYYQRFGKDNVIEYRRLLQELSPADRTLLMEKMEEFARKYPQWAHLLPVRESIYKLDQLEGLRYSILIQQLEIGAIEQQEFKAHFDKWAQNSANLAAEEMGWGTNFYRIDDQIITETVGKAWASGNDFSETIWDNREKLAAYLNDDFALAIAQGMSYDKLIKSLTDRFENVSRRDAQRLVFTEGTYLFNEAHARVIEQDFDYYRLSFVTEPGMADVPDEKVCTVCKHVAQYQKEEPVKFSERRPGVNFPPLHPNCRCSFLIEIPDQEDWLDRYVARHGGDYIQERDRPDLNVLHPDRIGRMTDEAGARPLPKERQVARWLADKGHTIVFRAIKYGRKTSDILIDGIAWEIKQPTGNGRQTIYHQFEEAAKQCSKLVLDISVVEKGSRWTRDTVESEAKRLMRYHFKDDNGNEMQFNEVLIVSDDGYVKHITKGANPPV